MLIYSLDVILAVGYRTNSKKAIEFRKWATKTLRQHILQGYTINPERIKHNYSHFLAAVTQIKSLLPKDITIKQTDMIDLLTAFADTWLSLDAYDKDRLATKGATKKDVDLTAELLASKLADLKTSLLAKKQATAIFGNERAQGGLSGIVGNVMQSFGGNQLYPTVEEKAAHLLYFIVKDHPFTDGNKRSGAFAFVWLLSQAGILDMARITPPALTALTILVAESNPAHKEKIISLILTLLSQ